MDFFQHIDLDLTIYKNLVFSLGTYEKNRYEQVLFPFTKMNTPINNTIIFAVDPEYKNMIKNKNQTIKINSLAFIYKTPGYYHCPEKNIQLFFISEKIQTDYPKYSLEAQESFSYCQKCITNSQKWITLFTFLKKLVDHQINIYINNWVFTNSRYFKEVNGSIKTFSNDIGHCFEYTPELGFILYKLYEETNYNKIYIKGFYMENGLYRHGILNIEQL